MASCRQRGQAGRRQQDLVWEPVGDEGGWSLGSKRERHVQDGVISGTVGMVLEDCELCHYL